MLSLQIRLFSILLKSSKPPPHTHTHSYYMKHTFFGEARNIIYEEICSTPSLALSPPLLRHGLVIVVRLPSMDQNKKN